MLTALHFIVLFVYYWNTKKILSSKHFKFAIYFQNHFSFFFPNMLASSHFFQSNISTSALCETEEKKPFMKGDLTETVHYCGL